MLTVCPTPIGNLGDLSSRQREALENADVILCEDTRVTGKLLELCGVARTEGRPRLWRLDDHTEAQKLADVMALLQTGANVVLVSDAGTPAIADPGFKVIREAQRRGLPYDVLPGASAVLVALVASGLALDGFAFVGFLEAKSGPKRQTIESWHRREITWAFFEAPHRLLETLAELEAVCGADHGVFVARELTKLHQEYLHGSVASVHESLARRDKVRGECVVVVAPGRRTDQAAVDLGRTVKTLADAGCSPQQVKAIASQLLGVSKAEAYAALQSLKG